ncbi:isoprenylcysteine carboxylmethyltransferase family protein [candidate division TA06 bacterium]|uniref:Isoprenylcysteine carboxylmethyltransferase family protein n=1 Tax=candidate division TA06 bacterium TaxID=2250710 RepID=A0A933MJ97_UNCT6|nr:isoprenylcysteine carboxylmethyltransferase family protein [candidate division TA06 bacterium]
MALKQNLGNLFFKWRSYTPIPLLLAALIFAKPTWWSLALGIAVTFLGEFIRIWAVSYAGGSTRTLSPDVGRLITGGPFGYVRNPLYVGNFLVSLGMCLAAWPSKWSLVIQNYAPIPWLLILFLPAFALQYGFIVALEEETLTAKLGQEFRTYCQNVPRWLPRLTPYGPSFPEQGNTRAAFRAERRSLQTLGITLLVIVVLFVWRTASAVK